MSKLAAVFDNVTITVKWLLHPFQGNLTCTLNAGDGHIIDPYSPAEWVSIQTDGDWGFLYGSVFNCVQPVTRRMESSIMHRFKHPGVYMVKVECSTSEWHVTAQRAITIQEPVGQFGFITCYSRNVSTDGTKCNTLKGRIVHIEVQVDTGESVWHATQSNYYQSTICSNRRMWLLLFCNRFKYFLHHSAWRPPGCKLLCWERDQTPQHHAEWSCGGHAWARLSQPDSCSLQRCHSPISVQQPGAVCAGASAGSAGCSDGRGRWMSRLWSHYWRFVRARRARWAALHIDWSQGHAVWEQRHAQWEPTGLYILQSTWRYLQL